ncbi:hypothetical protein BMF94_5421 [Rhodotorula taiwanensis]|uniref:Uncharacterized protein n=1 Tax=Rhodotorula taiwanensis TaxID=741276 RepID=A0A2S5B463_9BASI|nr:hypothetical protein BMF94_5421 [Rhodotorula taiwanensis]
MSRELDSTPDLVDDLPPLPQRGPLAQIFASPLSQVVIISLICFCTPGIFNANSGMGGGGQLDPKAANDANIALYCTFAVFGVLAGGIGSLTLAYATEGAKGRYFGIFWVLFNLGGVLGAAVELGISWDSTSNSVSNSVYIALLAIAACGAFLPALLANPATVVRTDGSRVIPPVHPTWRKEVRGMWDLIKTEKILVALLPLFFSSNFTYTYEQSTYNGHLFTLRTRALNSLLFWLFQMVGAAIFGVLIDLKRFSRVARAWSSLVFLVALHMAVWGASCHVQRGFHRDDNFVRIDLKEGRYAGYGALYVFQGILDATGSWAPSPPSPLSSLASSVSTRASSLELAATWTVGVAGLIFAIPVVAIRLRKGSEEEIEAAAEVHKHDEVSLASGEKKEEDALAA